MANWQTDKEYAKFVKERGGRRSGKGYERFLEKKAREKEAEEERQKKEKEREEDKIWILTTKAGKECAEQNNDISDENQRWENMHKARLNYETYKRQVIEWSKNDALGKRTLSECTETEENAKFEFLESAYKAAKKAADDEKRRLQAEKDRERQRKLEKRNAYKQKFSLAKGNLNAALFAENDRNRINDFLKSIEYSVGDENDAKLQEIASLDFHNPKIHNPKTGKAKGKIIWRVILMLLGWYVEGSLPSEMPYLWLISDLGYFLFILGIVTGVWGIVTGKKNKKAQIEAAQYNFELVKEIMYAKIIPTTLEEEAKKSLDEKIKDIYDETISKHVDSANLERLVLFEHYHKAYFTDIQKADELKEEINTAKKAFGIADGEKILFAYDGAVIKSPFSKGLVLSDKKFYLTDSNTSPERNIAVSFDEIGEITLAKKMGVYYIEFGKYSISIIISPDKDAKQLYEFLKKAILLVKTGEN